MRPQPANDRPSLSLPLALACLLLLAADPALANKFETISGGVSGSMQFKRAWLVTFFNAVGAISLLSAILAVVVPHKNALFLNFNNWKQSAIILTLISVACFAGAALL